MSYFKPLYKWQKKQTKLIRFKKEIVLKQVKLSVLCLPLIKFLFLLFAASKSASQYKNSRNKDD